MTCEYMGKMKANVEKYIDASTFPPVAQKESLYSLTMQKDVERQGYFRTKPEKYAQNSNLRYCITGSHRTAQGNSMLWRQTKD